MTPEEAAEVASIIKVADGGCVHCVEELAQKLAHSFPDHEWRTLTETVPADDAAARGEPT